MELPMMTETVDVCTVRYSWCWTHAATEHLKYGECNRRKEYLILIHLHLYSHIRPGSITLDSRALNFSKPQSPLVLDKDGDTPVLLGR